MTEFLTELVNVLLSVCSTYLITLFPMWKALGWKKSKALIYLGILTLYICAGYFFAALSLELDFQMLQIFKLCISIPALIVAVWMFRRQIWQIVFLISITFMYSLIGTGIGSYASVYWFAGFSHPALAANAVTLITFVLTLPPLLYLLRRLCADPNIKEAGIWKLVWLLPLTFFGLTLLAGSSFVFPEIENRGFFFIRVLIYAALLLTCYLLESSLRQVFENAKLAERASLMESQLDLQREQYERLTENAEMLNAIRHDLRHHMAALRQLADAGETALIKAYIEDLSGKLTASQKKRYCKNYAVNAIAGYYLSLAENEGVAVDARLIVPEDTGGVPAMDLCVIVGNFLENALEACRRMEQGERFVRIRSRLDGDTLSFVVTNSFDGQWKEKNGAYLSHKGQGGTTPQAGVGLSSVRAVCEMHRGLARYEADENIWKASALVHMGE